MSQIQSPTLFDLVLWIFRRRHRFQIEGLSMLPTLKDGDEVLIDRSAYQRSQPQINDLVILRHPHQPNFYLIKRITAIESQGQTCFVEGDNREASTDSNHFGWISQGLLVGKVTSLFL
ncbi:MAG: nickel-type superoxide dismutase maturation protease [Synechococcaceae cyanobacterium RL_1_2]|nr:nickel-type superoxide dismutase maturation protease [Synechococcaceae cyanobacterium RL_1_2]